MFFDKLAIEDIKTFKEWNLIIIPEFHPARDNFEV